MFFTLSIDNTHDIFVKMNKLQSCVQWAQNFILTDRRCVLPFFGECPPFCRNTNDILCNSWESVENGTFEPRKKIVAGHMSGNEQLGNNSKETRGACKRITAARIAKKIQLFRNSRKKLVVPQLSSQVLIMLYFPYHQCFRLSFPNRLSGRTLFLGKKFQNFQKTCKKFASPKKPKKIGTDTTGI